MSEDYTRERVIGSLSDDLRVFIQKGESDTWIYQTAALWFDPRAAPTIFSVKQIFVEKSVKLAYFEIILRNLGKIYHIDKNVKSLIIEEYKYGKSYPTI
jgi:hypothetical protein